MAESPHTYIEKPTHTKTSHCLVRILVQRHNFENEQGMARTVDGDRYRTMLNEFLFTKIGENDIGKFWTVLRATQPKLHSMFCAMFLKILSFSDEGHLDLGGYVNKQNPHAYIEKPTDPKQVTVWCGFWSRSINGPFVHKN